MVLMAGYLRSKLIDDIKTLQWNPEAGIKFKNETRRNYCERSDAARISLPADQTCWSLLPPGFLPRPHAKTNVGTGGLRRKVHDRLPRGVSGIMVQKGKAVTFTCGSRNELLQGQCLQTPLVLDRKGMDSTPGPERMVSVVLSILYGQTFR